MIKQKNPIKAVYLNIILPGLGLAYLGRWGTAALFFLWTPLRLLGGMAVINILPLPQTFGVWGQIGRYVLLYAWWAVVMYDTCTAPYRLALEHNQKVEQLTPGKES